MQNAFYQTEFQAEVKYISVMRLKPKEGSGVHFYDRDNNDVLIHENHKEDNIDV